MWGTGEGDEEVDWRGKALDPPALAVPPPTASVFHFIAAPVRQRTLEFLVDVSLQLAVAPVVKYTALSLFADRFLPSLLRLLGKGSARSWLLRPLRESNMQLFTLISLWISSKLHDTSALSSKSLKSLGDRHIGDQHFTLRDFVEAERIFLEVVRFEIGTSNVVFTFLEELLIQFRELSRFGELVSLDTCMDIMDLLYEREDMACFYNHPQLLASSILISAYVLTVQKHQWEFPLLPWAKSAISCEEQSIAELVKRILEHILTPTVLETGNLEVEKSHL